MVAIYITSRSQFSQNINKKFQKIILQHKKQVDQYKTTVNQKFEEKIKHILKCHQIIQLSQHKIHELQLLLEAAQNKIQKLEVEIVGIQQKLELKNLHMKDKYLMSLSKSHSAMQEILNAQIFNNQIFAQMITKMKLAQLTSQIKQMQFQSVNHFKIKVFLNGLLDDRDDLKSKYSQNNRLKCFGIPGTNYSKQNYGVQLSQQKYFLNLSKIKFDIKELISYKNWDHLEYLNISQCNLQNADWKLLTQQQISFKSLKVLIASGNQIIHIHEEQLQKICLQYIDLNKNPLSEYCISKIPSFKCKRLTTLKLMIKAKIQIIMLKEKKYCQEQMKKKIKVLIIHIFKFQNHQITIKQNTVKQFIRSNLYKKIIKISFFLIRIYYYKKLLIHTESSMYDDDKEIDFQKEDLVTKEQVEVQKTQSTQKTHSPINDLIQYFNFFHQTSQQNYQDLNRSLQHEIPLKTSQIMKKSLNQYRQNLIISTSHPIKQLSTLIKTYHQKNQKIIKNKIIKNGIFQISQQNYYYDLKIMEFIPSKHYQVIELTIQLMKYKTKIQVLNCKANSFVHHHCDIEAFGSYGNVYFTHFDHQDYAIKCIPFTNPEDKHNNQDIFINFLQKVLKQYFFMLLFSQLQIGPKTKKIYGFDIIMSSSCIQWSMQKCKQKQFSLEQQYQLKKNLEIMHILQIIHHDIKPQNIMYSKQFKKPVLIDFGQSGLIKQMIGQKSLSKFIGTTGFCSGQMVKLLTYKMGYVDLYCNDVFGLNKALNVIRNGNRIEQHDQFSFRHDISANQQQRQTKYSFFVIMLKFYLYNDLTAEFEFYYKFVEEKYPQNIQNLQRQLLNFLIEVKPTQLSEVFYLTNIREDLKNDPEFRRLNQYYSTNHGIELLYSYEKDVDKCEIFKQAKYIWSLASILLSAMNNEQRLIEMNLISKQSIQKHLFSKLLQYKGYIECNYKTYEDLFQQINFPVFCYIVLKYCTFVENQYKINHQDKIKLCKQVMMLVKERNNKNKLFKKLIDEQNNLFQCSIQEFKPIWQFMLFYILQIHYSLVIQYQHDAMINSISTLAVLGFPFYIKQIKQHFCSIFIQTHSSNAIDKILIFWQFNNIVNNFQWVCFDKKDNKLFQSEQYNFMNVSLKVQQQMFRMFTSHKDQNNQLFIDTNMRVYQSLYIKKTQYNERDLNKTFQQLSGVNIYCKSSVYPNISHRYLVAILLYTYHFNYIYHGQIILCRLFNQDTSMLKYKRTTTLPVFSSILCVNYQTLKNFNKLYELLNVVDDIIFCEQISQRLWVDARIQLAYHRGEFNKVQTLINLVAHNIHSVTEHNFKIINFVITPLQKISNDIKRSIQTQHKKILINTQTIQTVCKRSLYFIQQINKNLSRQKYNQQQKMLFNQIDSNVSLTNQSELPYKQTLYIQQQTNFALIIKFVLLTINSLLSIYRSILQMTKQSQKILSKSSLSQAETYSVQINSVEEEYQTTLQMFQNFVNNHIIRSYIKSRLYHTSQVVLYYMSLLKLTNYNIESLVQTYFQEFIHQPLMNKPIAISYLLLKIKKQPLYMVKWKDKLIEVYQVCVAKNFKSVLFQKELLVAILDAYLLKNASNQKIYKFFATLNQEITNSTSSKQKFIIFHQAFKNKFSCQSVKCYSSDEEKQSILNRITKFIQFIAKHKFTKYHQQNGNYIILIHYYSIQNKNISIQTKKKLIILVRKSLKFLSLNIRQIIFQKIFMFQLQYENNISTTTNPGINQSKPYNYQLSLFTFTDKIKSCTESQNHNQCIQLNTSHIQSQQLQRYLKLNYKLYLKCIKKQQRLFWYHLYYSKNSIKQNIKQIVQKHFQYKHIINSNNLILPPKILQIYRKKLYKKFKFK